MEKNPTISRKIEKLSNQKGKILNERKLTL